MDGIFKLELRVRSVMKPAPSPLARSVDKDVLDWDGVAPAPPARAPDVLGLGPEDRAALGMSAARPIDIAPHASGDAHAALVEVLARGGAVSAETLRRKRR